MSEFRIILNLFSTFNEFLGNGNACSNCPTGSYSYAGTGKTTAVQTMLQELQHVMQQHGLPAEFVRVAAPTGSAAFNLRFNATTVHRLIQWFNPPFFQAMKNPEHLAALQHCQRKKS